MRWYLFVGMLFFFNTVAPMQSMVQEVPSLETDQFSMDDVDDLFMRILQPSTPKIPRWQMILQEWGSLFVVQMVRIKEYANGQYEKMKMIMYAMLYRNNLVAKK